MSEVAAARLYVLLARESPAAVVFRRGPSKRVLLLSWNTETDELREGQWLNGRTRSSTRFSVATSRRSTSASHRLGRLVARRRSALRERRPPASRRGHGDVARGAPRDRESERSHLHQSRSVVGHQAVELLTPTAGYASVILLTATYVAFLVGVKQLIENRRGILRA